MEIKVNKDERLDDLQFNNLFIIQKREGYCFTSDAVALANFVKTKPNSKIIDLCSGSGVIGILAHEKNKAKNTILVEIQEAYAEMSKRTIEYNKQKGIEVINARLQNISKILGVGCADVVVCNPPYKKTGTTKLINDDMSIAIARHEIEVTLEEIVFEASKLLKFGGDFYTINKEERLADLIVYLRKYGLEPKQLRIIPSSKGANIIMIKAKKGGKSGMSISLVNR